MSIEIRRAADRFVSQHAGVVSYHCFSAGAHYDPANVSFAGVIAVDEHVVAPGAGFDWHAHRGVTIVSWVLDGALRHEDGNGEARVVQPGELFVQLAADGIRHRETNASSSEGLRFVQTTLLGDVVPAVDVVSTATALGPAHVFVARGQWQLGAVAICEGDSVRLAEPSPFAGTGELLVVSID